MASCLVGGLVTMRLETADIWEFFVFVFVFTTLGGSEFYLEDDGKLSFPHKSVSATATRSPPHAHAARGSAHAGLCAGPSRSPSLAPCYVL